MFGFLQLIGVKGWWMIILVTASALPASSESFVPSRAILSVAQDGGAPDGGRKLTVQECFSEANRLSGTWSAKGKSVEEMMTSAKKTKNVIRQNCIEPKLKDVNFGIDEGKTTLTDMKTGMKTGISQDRMELLLQKVRVIDSNIEEAVMNAGNCVGDEQFSSGDGFELKGTHPEEEGFDPDGKVVLLDDPLSHDSNFIPTNPDWSVELTWPNASPYK